jgi:hypothetical protein
MKVNGFEVDENLKFIDFFNKKFYGVNKYFILKFKKRFEFFFLKNAEELVFSVDQTLQVFKFLIQIFPLNLCFSNKKLVSILFLNTVWNYKGWRHFKGLPCRGQRTWSNAWSVFRSNSDLRKYKYKNLKRIYGKFGGPEQRLSFLCEYVNFLWKSQWFLEWLHSRKTIRAFIKKKKYIFKLDLFATSKGLLANLKKNNSSVTKKKKKLLTGTVGFDTGFTKLYLKFKYSLTTKLRKKLKKK